MSQGSSNPASPSRLVTASEQQETLTPVSHVFGLSEVSASLEALNTEVERKPTVVHRAQASYSPGASMTPWSPNARDHRRSTQASPFKLKRYALQIWLEVEVGPGYFLPPEDDSHSTYFTLEVLNHAYSGCTGVYLDRGGHMLAFYGRKGSPKAGLIQDVAIEACHAVREIPTWMGLTAKWRVKCVSLAEAKYILAGCKRLEQENRRRERQYFQERFAPMHQPSGLSVNVAPFQPQAAVPMPRPAEMPSDHREAGSRGPKDGFSPSRRLTTSSVGKIPSPMRGPYPQTSDDDVTSDGGLVDPSSHRKGKRGRGSRGSRSGEGSDSSHSVRSSASRGGRRKKKDGFSSKIQIPEFGGKKGHSGEVTDAFRQWARCITYYRDYYEDSYLMPLVVSSLTGDASDVFDWILSLKQGKPQDLTTLLQMLREHYCGSLTFREQRNTIENLRQKSNEAAIDFLIWVGTSVSSLAKDWKDELTEYELQALQNEVSLNGVKEEIRHVLDSEMAKRDGRLTPQQMYEAVKKYETYVARNRRLDGKGISTPAGQQKATGQSSGYKPRFHKTTAFVATTGGPNDESDHPPGEDSDSHEVEPPPKEDEGLYIPSYLEEAIPDDPALQVKVARALRVQEMNSRRCFTCNRPGHLAWDHQEWEEKNGIRPSSRRGQLQTERPRRRPDQNPLSPDGQGLPRSREGTILEPGCFFQVHWPQELGPGFDQ